MSALYSYTGRSDRGAFVAGSLEADSVDAAVAHLRARALFVTTLERADTLPGLAASALSFGNVDPSAKVTFFRSFATLVGAGVPMQRAFDVTIEQCRDARFREALRSVASDVECGSALSAAMSARPRDFAPLFIAMIRAGELGGVLHEALEWLAQLLEGDRAMRKRVRGALAYPAIVTLCAAGLVTFLIANVVPSFAGMFAELHAALPLSTRILIAAGLAMQSPFAWIVVAVTAVALAGSVHALRRSSAGRYRLDALVLATPPVGALLRKVMAARLARTLGTLLRTGVEITTALEATEGVVGNAVYERCVRALLESLRRGDPLTQPLRDSGRFEGLFLQLVRVGEETGSLDAMLLRIAASYERDIEASLAALASVIEPLLIVALGAIVGAIVASVLIPLYSIIGSIK